MYKKVLCILTSFAFFFGSISAKELVPGGESIGIQVSYDGVLVSGTYTFMAGSQRIDPSHVIKVNDLIIAINGVKVASLQDMANEMNKYQKEINDLTMTIIRNDAKMDVSIQTSYDKTGFHSGLYVKDKITGVGTISYYDPDTGKYGALGHEIMDSDTHTFAKVHEGNIYPAIVDGIQKAKKNVPGEKQATIDFTKSLGDVEKNSSLGIFGQYDLLPENKQAIEVGDHTKVHTGKAMIYTVLSGNQIEMYQITITKVNKQNSRDMKGIELIVDDPALTSQTNGIIQGMSGSPIIQDGQIVGALTHVVTSDPMRGYGVFIDWMLEESVL